ncbi:MAG: hypothetical protein ACOYNW_01790, partial [Undibacterium curvum]|uniref:hypothetical protein n=1 Tax=Undibacterium curvum TaxID=2762294 RepID=UPI003BDD308C
FASLPDCLLHAGSLLFAARFCLTFHVRLWDAVNPFDSPESSSATSPITPVLCLVYFVLAHLIPAIFSSAAIDAASYAILSYKALV